MVMMTMIMMHSLSHQPASLSDSDLFSTTVFTYARIWIPENLSEKLRTFAPLRPRREYQPARK